MRKVVLLLLVCCGSMFAQDDVSIAKAVEGAQALHSAMRDPDSFKIGKVWIMSVAKFGDVAVCFDYYARNGYGGMNASHADYAPHSAKDFKKGKYILSTYNDEAFENYSYFEDFKFRCGAPALKHGYLARDVTKEVQQMLAAASDAK